MIADRCRSRTTNASRTGCMNTTDLVHYVSTGERPRPTAARPAPSRFLSSARRPVAARHSASAAVSVQRTACRRLLVRPCRRRRVARQRSGSCCWPIFGQEHSEQAEQAARAILDMPASRRRLVPVSRRTGRRQHERPGLLRAQAAGYDPASDRLTQGPRHHPPHGGADAADAHHAILSRAVGAD